MPRGCPFCVRYAAGMAHAPDPAFLASRAQLEALDRADELRRFRDEF